MLDPSLPSPDPAADYLLFVQGATDRATLLTDAEGRIRDWTPGAETLFGWTADEAIGRSIDLFYTPRDRERSVPGEDRATAFLHTPWNVEAWRVRKDGLEFFALSRCIAPT